MKLGLKAGAAPRSRRVVNDTSSSSAMVMENWNECLWSNLPCELLREVLIKVEESESEWPARKHVVACAGVCKTWRYIIKELVSTPELSGKITFPISIKQPGPRDSLFHCFIKRNRSTQTYNLFMNLSQALADDGKFIMAARKCRRPTCTDYVISLHSDDMSKGNDTYVGKLRSNFLGTKFIVYDALPPHSGTKVAKSWSSIVIGSKQVSPKIPTGNYPVGHLSYELNVLGARGPRRMHCVMDAIPASSIKPGGVAPTQTHFSMTRVDSSPTMPYFQLKSNSIDKVSEPLTGQRDGSLILRNKAPRWHEQLQCWCLNFHGRVTVASVKNFQLVASPENNVSGPEHDKVILQFGKVGKDVFTMDYRYPISAFQAFAICLSSFDTKIACE